MQDFPSIQPTHQPHFLPPGLPYQQLNYPVSYQPSSTCDYDHSGQPSFSPVFLPTFLFSFLSSFCLTCSLLPIKPVAFLSVLSFVLSQSDCKPNTVLDTGKTALNKVSPHLQDSCVLFRGTEE